MFLLPLVHPRVALGEIGAAAKRGTGLSSDWSRGRPRPNQKRVRPQPRTRHCPRNDPRADGSVYLDKKTTLLLYSDRVLNAQIGHAHNYQGKIEARSHITPQ